MKIMVGLSGGVDSAVACYLLKKAGHDVVAGFMRNWDALANNDYLGNNTLNKSICPQEQDYEDAKMVAEILGVELYRVDFIKEYWDEVFSYFLQEYQCGRTPNPDIFCNKYIKFDAFIKFAESKGCDMIATGHYAKRIEKDRKVELHKSFDKNKDQTYFLSQLTQEQIAKCLFPLGDIDKNEVRNIAKKLNLVSVANKKDSTGVCFIGERNFKEFLKNYLPAKQGKIIDINTNEVVGQHEGSMYYTIGQRRGLGIGGIKGKEAKSWFVVKKDVKNNVVFVTNEENDEHLLSDRAMIEMVNFNCAEPKEKTHINCKFRYRQKDLPVTIEMLDATHAELVFDQPYSAITTGQAAVFYEGDICLGGGIIKKVFYKNKRIDI